MSKEPLYMCATGPSTRYTTGVPCLQTNASPSGPYRWPMPRVLIGVLGAGGRFLMGEVTLLLTTKWISPLSEHFRKWTSPLGEHFRE